MDVSFQSSTITGRRLFRVLIAPLILRVDHWSQNLRKPINAQAMHFDANVVSEVSGSSQHIGDKFHLVHDLVAKKVLHEQNKGFSWFQFHFVYWGFKVWFSDGSIDLRIKNANFQLLNNWFCSTSNWSGQYLCQDLCWTAWLNWVWCALVKSLLSLSTRRLLMTLFALQD